MAKNGAGKISPLVRSLIREDYGMVDKKVPNIIGLLTQRGADECWHKVSEDVEFCMFSKKKKLVSFVFSNVIISYNVFVSIRLSSSILYLCGKL
jgi:hypothetical protein